MYLVSLEQCNSKFRFAQLLKLITVSVNENFFNNTYIFFQQCILTMTDYVTLYKKIQFFQKISSCHSP